jgi:D-alanyl-D-alanine carboxypeptidase/D-alanyl-D-alanine-endopeptidase (penicillin-binding protein 4)
MARRRRIHPVAVLVVVAAVPALVLGAAWWLADARAEEGEVAEAPATSTPDVSEPAAPLLSVRRAPTTLAVDTALGPFAFQLEPLADDVDDTSCLVVTVDQREALADGATTAVIPASNLKLVTGAVALEELGPDHRFTTTLQGTVVDGAVQGDLYFVGGGDPLLAVPAYPATQQYPPEPRTPIESLVEQLVAAGVTRVDGAVLGDDSRYDAVRDIPSWGDGIRGTEAGPLGALMVNDASLSSTPIKPADPAVGAATELTALLEAVGITVAGEPGRGVPPAGLDVLATVQSAPVSEVVAEMFTTSDDNTAELLVKELGVVAGTGGSTDAGLQVERDALSAWGVPLEGVSLVDGSGLSRENRLTCAALATVLARHVHDDVFGSGLALAGQTGTMEPYFQGTPLDGALRAKTGTLNGVKSFSGYLGVDGGASDIRFALVVNGTGANTRGVEIFDALGRAFVAYPTAPGSAELAPGAAP